VCKTVDNAQSFCKHGEDSAVPMCRIFGHVMADRTVSVLILLEFLKGVPKCVFW
jgi:hypothetical protein